MSAVILVNLVLGQLWVSGHMVYLLSTCSNSQF